MSRTFKRSKEKLEQQWIRNGNIKISADYAILV